MKNNFKSYLQVALISLGIAFGVSFVSHAEPKEYIPEEILEYGEIVVLDKYEYLAKEEEWDIEPGSTYGFHVNDNTSRIFVAAEFGHEKVNETIVHEVGHRLFNLVQDEILNVDHPEESPIMQKLIEKKGPYYSYLFIGQYGYGEKDYNTEIFARCYAEQYEYLHGSMKALNETYNLADPELIEIFDYLEQKAVEKISK